MNYNLTIVLVETNCMKKSKNSKSCDKPSSKVLGSSSSLHMSFMSCKSNIYNYNTDNSASFDKYPGSTYLSCRVHIQ